MGLTKRYCVEYVDGTVECFREGFWYSDTGIIVKWAILAGFFLFFMGWFLGGYLHAKSRMKKGKPLLGYHRWLVSYSERKKYGQTPQNHFTFYSTQQPYGQPQYGPRPDGTWPEPPPMYTGDAPPGYVPPPGATKMNPDQNGNAMEMPPYGVPPPMGAQQTGVVGGNGDVENQHGAQMPPRPQQAKLAIGKLIGRFRR
ncbi:hypothetical protein K458DRAFT_419572 [Lentithecium fluviatile CBS 122367]|uniref:Uncharacterized protein n=1 Tax=Lentithecium fluviatile CBS 122367 TaxID=1168545 RepID=A0A6G1IWU9_9PLEO|nr:hypothetical protein K458DRAFT_419572 [Lentithecium fluviatile CBS 122367]